MNQINPGDRVTFHGGYARVIATDGDKAWLRWEHLEPDFCDTIFPDLSRLVAVGEDATRDATTDAA
jgi:hypothetical protein